MKLFEGLIAAVVTCGMLGIAPPAFADKDHKQHGERRAPMGFQGAGDDAMAGMVERHMGLVLEMVKATPEQRAKIKAIRAQHLTSMKPIREALMGKRGELFKEIKGSQGSRDRAIALQREVSTLQNQLAEGRLMAWFEARAALTPEQLKKLETMPSRRGKRHKREGARR